MADDDDPPCFNLFFFIMTLEKHLLCSSTSNTTQHCPNTTIELMSKRRFTIWQRGVLLLAIVFYSFWHEGKVMFIMVMYMSWRFLRAGVKSSFY